MPRDPDAILVLRLGGIGEVLAITPALEALRDRFRRAWITLLAERTPGGIARPWVDDVVEADAPYRATGVASLLRGRLYAESIRLVERVMRRKYDLYLDFHHVFARRQAVKPFLAAMLSRAPRRIGFGSPFFLTDRVADPDERHMSERARALLAPLGIEVRRARPILRVSADDREWVDALLAASGLEGKRLVALAPGSSRPETRWSAIRFREAGDRLARHGPVLSVGTADERALCAEAGGINLAGRTTVGRLAALLARCALLVANDSGPLHMAYALGTPAVGLFRPAELPRWGAYADRRGLRTLARDGPGAVEGRTLPLISVDDVVTASEELLLEDPPRP